jgi:undecaprenyl-diphosphatase
MDNLWVAVILGIVEGVTEYLPVSSTGHLIVAGTLLNFEGEKAACFDVFIQLGAILAVVCLYWRRFTGLIPVNGLRIGAYSGFAGMNGLACLALTTAPALVAGLFAHKAIKTYLFGPVTVAAALAVGALGILAAERFKPAAETNDLNGLGYGQALLVGVFQCFALWPGMSRSASTIVGGMLSGLDRDVAAEYSFLAAVPVMVAAVTYDLYKGWHFLRVSDVPFFAVGFLVSFLSAAMAVKTLVAMVQRWSLAPFAWYRLAIAPIIYLFMGSA